MYREQPPPPPLAFNCGADVNCERPLLSCSPYHMARRDMVYKWKGKMPASRCGILQLLICGLMSSRPSSGEWWEEEKKEKSESWFSETTLGTGVWGESVLTTFAYQTHGKKCWLGSRADVDLHILHQASGAHAIACACVRIFLFRTHWSVCYCGVCVCVCCVYMSMPCVHILSVWRMDGVCEWGHILIAYEIENISL